MDSKTAALQKIANMLDQKSLLITGGTGFVGRALVSLLQRVTIEYNISIRCHIASRSLGSRDFSPKSSGFNIERVKIDLLNPDPIIPEVDLVVHAVMPQPAVMNSFSPMEMLLASVTSTTALLDCFRTWKSPPRLLFTSSGAVYGESIDSQTKWTEDSRIAPETFTRGGAYGEGKRVSEMLASIASTENLCQTMIARMFTFSGLFLPLDQHFAVGNFVRDSLLGQDILIHHDGRATRTYLDSEDMAIWLLIILLFGQSNFPYHVGSEKEITIAELAELVATRSQEIFGHRPVVSTLNDKKSLVQFDRYVPSTLMTRNALDLHEWTSLSDSIDLMLRFK